VDSRVNFAASATIGATMTAFSLFDTAIGRCAIAWGARGIACVQLPETDEPTTRARMLQRFPGTRESPPPPEVARAGSYRRASPRRAARSFICFAGHGPRAAIPPPRLRGHAEHSVRRDDDLRRSRGTGRRRGLGARRWASSRPKPICDHRAVPSGRRGGRQGRRFLREWRRHDETPAPRDRRHAKRAPGIFDRRSIVARPHRYG
jgi:hypothetical protein